MTAMRNVIHEGWLTKSPPEKKTRGHWKIFPSKWRKRYFILSNVHASNMLPGTCPAQLDYFDSNAKQAKHKGSINLNNCDSVIVHLETEYYKHVFKIRTTDRGRARTYYLAAESENEMEQWVKHLVKIVGLEDDGSGTQGPYHPNAKASPPRSLSVPDQRFNSTTTSHDTSSMLSPLSDPFDSLPPQSYPPNAGGDYLALWDGGTLPTPAPRTIPPKSVQVVPRQNPSNMASVSTTSLQTDSMSDRNSGNRDSSLGSDSPDDIYNHPKTLYDRDSDVYKVPPLNARGSYEHQRDSDIYKVPPVRNLSRNDSTYDYPPPLGGKHERDRDSNYDYPPPLAGHERDRDSNYDYPPPLNSLRGDVNSSDSQQYDIDDDGVRPIWECASGPVESISDTYDIFPSKSDATYDILPVGSPPVPVLSNGMNSLNRQKTSDGNITTRTLDDVYDIPTLSSKSSYQLPPPRPHVMPVKIHKYVNAASTPVVDNQRGTRKSQEQGPADDVYLPMTSAEANDVYLPMTSVEKAGSQTPGRSQSNVSKKYNGAFQSPSPRSVSTRIVETSAMYSRPTVAESRKLEEKNLEQGPADGVHGTQRTRSFRRSNPSTSTDIVILPQKKSGVADDSSSDEDDDDDSVGSSAVQEYINLHRVGGSRTESNPQPINPQPQKQKVQYLDLDFDQASAEVSPSPISSTCVSMSKIEYDEIDMERTKALIDTKLMLEKERKGSDRSDA